MIDKKVRNKIYLDNLGYVLLMPIIVDFLSVIVQQFNIIESSNITMIIYALSLVIILYRVTKISSFNIIIKDIFLLLLAYLPFIINYLIFPNTREYIISQSMLIIYLFFFPIIIFSVRKITSWNLFFEAMLRPGIIALVISLFLLLFLDYGKYLVYMGFSYALLPFVCNFYRASRTERYNKRSNKKKRYIYFICFIIGFLIMLIFGARAAVFFSLLYIGMYEILRKDNSRQKKIITIMILVALAVITLSSLSIFATWLMKFEIFKDSYILKNIVSGQLMESTSRNVLYEACIQRITSMGFEISGLFGDRVYCLEYPYPHNIIFEVIMSHGWILGLFFLLFYSIMLIKAVFNKSSNKQEVALFVAITILARYIISGSYLIEGKFWIATVIIFVIAKRSCKIERPAEDVL